ncbi:hypothetical protein D3C80_1762380 [compost metagenome]
MLRTREHIGYTDIVGEADPARILPGFPRKHNLILIAVAVHEQFQLIPYCPRIHHQLKKQLIRRQIQRIHHPVLAFVDNPQILFPVMQQLRASVIAVNRM